MRSLLLLFIISFGGAVSAFALTMDEAVQSAFTHNPKIMQYKSLEQASAARANKGKAPFWPSLHASYLYTDADDKNGYATYDQSSVSTSARYNLFNGGSDWFRMNEGDYRANAAGNLLRSITADVALEVQRAFINQLRMQRNVATEQQSVELLERQRKDSELRLREGLIARNDLLRVEVELASAKQRLLRAEGDLRIANKTLMQVIGQPIDETNELVDFDNNPIYPVVSDSELRAEMLAARSELRYLNNQLAADTSGRKAVRGDLLPDIDVVVSYDEFGNVGYPENGDIDYDSDSRAMVEASWTLFSGFDTRYELASRKHEIDAKRREIKATEDLLTLQLQTALEELRVARGNLETARTAQAQAEENFRVNENRYKARVATTVDLLDAQEFLTRSRNEQIKALYDLHLAAAVLDRVLERNSHVINSDKN
jgi:outer membrane protein TolC